MTELEEEAKQISRDMAKAETEYELEILLEKMREIREKLNGKVDS